MTQNHSDSYHLILIKVHNSGQVETMRIFGLRQLTIHWNRAIVILLRGCLGNGPIDSSLFPSPILCYNYMCLESRVVCNWMSNVT